MKILKWSWMIDYCKRKGLPPAQSWAWEDADEAYENNGGD